MSAPRSNEPRRVRLSPRQRRMQGLPPAAPYRRRTAAEKREREAAVALARLGRGLWAAALTARGFERAAAEGCLAEALAAAMGYQPRAAEAVEAAVLAHLRGQSDAAVVRV